MTPQARPVYVVDMTLLGYAVSRPAAYYAITLSNDSSQSKQRDSSLLSDYCPILLCWFSTFKITSIGIFNTIGRGMYSGA